ncbi:retrovirus-related pol polyprotein from transposon TNT 1-94, partial [Tanacetum coccineum]
DFQDSPDDEEDTRSSHEYLNDLEEEYQARALLAKSKRFFKKGCKRLLHKPELRPTKDFEVKYNKVKARLALLSSSSSASMVKNKCLIAEAYKWDEEEVSSDDNEMVEVKVLMALAEENDVVSKEGAKNGKWVKISIKKVHTLLEMEDNDDRKVCLDYLCIDLNYVEEQRSNLLSKHRNLVHELNACKEQLLVLKQSKLDFLTIQHVNTKILKENKNLRTKLKELKQSLQHGLTVLTKAKRPGVERPWLSEAEGFILPNHDTSRILPSESQINTTDPSVAVTDSSTTDYDSADESLVRSTLLPLLKKLDGVEPIFRPKTIKSILRSKSTFKVEALKSVLINEPSSAPAKGNKSSSASKVHSAPAGNLKSVKIKDDPPLAIVLFCKKCERTDHRTCNHAEYISTMNMSQHLKSLGRMSSNLTSQDYQNASFHLAFTVVCDIRNPIWYLDSGCTRHMTGVKSYLHKYVKQPGPKMVFRDDSTCTTEGYCSIKCNDIVFTKVAFLNGLKYNLISISQLCDAKYIVQFDEKRGIIFNSNKEIVMIAPRVRDVYVLDMTSSAQESCFFAKASENLNWLWHKRLAHLNFKTINKLAKQNLVIGLPSLVYSKDKPCSSCEKLERYPPDEYLHPYEPYQRYQTNSNDVSFIVPYECPEPVVLETKVLSDQNDQTNQNDQPVQNDEILNDDHSEHSNHTNDEQIIDSLPNTENI